MLPGITSGESVSRLEGLVTLRELGDNVGGALTSTELLPHSVEVDTTVQHPYERAEGIHPAQAVQGTTEPYPPTGPQWVRFPPAPPRPK